MAIMSIDGRPFWKRIGWFVGLWAAGVAAVSLVAFAIRSVLL